MGLGGGFAGPSAGGEDVVASKKMNATDNEFMLDLAAAFHISDLIRTIMNVMDKRVGWERPFKCYTRRLRLGRYLRP